QRARVGTGGENDVLSHDGLVAHLNAVRGDQATFALDHRDSAGLDQAGESLELAGHDLLAIRGDSGDVDAVEGRRDAVLRGLASDIRYLCRVQQRLGRNAADVPAGP